MIITYKFLRGHSHFNIEQFYKVRKESRTRGHERKLSKESVRRDVRKTLFSSRVVDSWR